LGKVKKGAPQYFGSFLRKMKGIVLKNVGETSAFFTA
jgi:hypothetical protein